MTVHAVIPASGLSSRMGTCKSLLKIGNETLLAFQVRFLNDLDINHIHVATRNNPALTAEINKLNIHCIQTHDATHSMLDTIRLAIKHLPTTCTGLLVLPSDHPPLNKPLWQSLKHAFEQHAERIVVPSFNDKRGHPIFIPHSFFAAIQTKFDGVGLRGLYQYAANSILHIESPDNSIHHNLNTPEQWLEFIKKSGYSGKN